LQTPKAFGRALRKRRTKKNLSQEKLAELADLHPTYISMLERGTKGPSLETVFALAKALGISAVKLVRDTESIQQRK